MVVRSNGWLGTSLTELLAAAPIARATTVVSDRQDTDLIPDDGVDEAERETARDKTTCAVTPTCFEAWVAQENIGRALELCEEGLR